MTQLPCPPWENPEPQEKLPGIANAAAEIYQFILRQNPKKYLLNHGDLKTWHGKLFKDAVPVPYYAGNYRSPEARHPCLNNDVAVANSRGDVFYGAPFQEVAGRMQQFSDKLEDLTMDVDKFCASRNIDIVTTKAATELAAFAAGNIIQIHPFANGNGRIARLTANFFFNRYGLGMPFYINRPAVNKIEYETASAAAMALGDFKPLFQYFVTVLSLT